MENRTIETEFNRLIRVEAREAIAKAFISLDIHTRRICEPDVAKDFIEHKSDEAKRELCSFIDDMAQMVISNTKAVD